MVEKFDYLQSQQDAEDLIAEFGQIGAIPRSVSTPGPNPWDPPTNVTTCHRVTVALLPIDLQDVGRDISGTVIKASDQQALVSPVGLAIVPTTTDILLVNGEFVGNEYVGGEPWIVSAAKMLAPAGVPVLHDLIVSR
ncbi:hypothetical protein [Paradevosia shaoguanensis]|uniref:hypothetical protein n=1 Tax=Paradevosia shaoguanensis TaxID=1335043 RepID=UPI001932B597|nr:hypothetical protein [Paradevosia shaoguanensis]